MSAQDNGGPAFPVTRYETGMTMRDFFAAKALPVAMEMMRMDFNRDLGDEWAWNYLEIEQCAEHAYQLADAMLSARSKT